MPPPLQERTMQFTLLVFENPRGFSGRTDPKERDAYWQGTFAFLAELKQSGAFAGGAGLELPSLACSLASHETDSRMTRGPVPRDEWQLGGYFIVEAADVEAALAMAARFPRRPGVAIEVRPNLAHD
jgi:hypothetical protein